MNVSDKRKTISKLICDTWDLLENGGHTNSTHFINNTKDFTDGEFIQYINDIVNDPKKHFYFEIELFENEPRFEDVETAANYLDVKLFDYVFMPHLSDDPDKPICTVHKIFVGMINMRRLQQMV